MGELTTTSYLILGMLASRDWSAYEIAEQIGRGVTEIWPRANRGLYDAPKRLVERGLAESSQVWTGKRQRTVYSITPRGMEALGAWLAESSKPSALEFEGMVRVILADSGSLDDLRNNLRTMAEQAARTRDDFVRAAELMLVEASRRFPERLHVMALANRFMIEHFCLIGEWATWAYDEVGEWVEVADSSSTRVEQAVSILEESIRRASTSAERTDRPRVTAP